MKATREKLGDDAVKAFVEAHDGWVASGAALRRAYRFATYGEGVAFAVAVAFAAEKRNHHPDLHIGYGSVEVVWTTHDAGGVTRLDLEMAEVSDSLA